MGEPRLGRPGSRPSSPPAPSLWKSSRPTPTATASPTAGTTSATSRSSRAARPARRSSKCLRFENDKPGRPARISRAFGVDGRKVEAVVVGLWVRQESIASGERLGDDPGLVVDFYSDPLDLHVVRRGSLGPWKTVGGTWTHVVKKMPIPPDTRLAILSVGLIGATGILEVDDMTVDLVPVGGKVSANLAVNGDYELGDPEPTGWLVAKGAHRVSPGHRSASAIELKGTGARATSGIALPVARFNTIELTAVAKANGIRGANGAMGLIFFLDDDGEPLPNMQTGVPVINFSGTFPWQPNRGVVDVPPGATRALVQFEKGSAYGTITIDDVVVTGTGGLSEWTPDHVTTDTTSWLPVSPSPSIVAGSALDASMLLDAPAGKNGFVTVKEGRLHFTKGGRARFFGVSLLPPTAFPERTRADDLAERLARSGVNLVRLADLDTPLGPARSLFDDARDDTKQLDPDALARLDHLIAALKAKGIYVAIEIQGARKFRTGDNDTIADAHRLPPGGGAAAAFDPAVREAARKTAEQLLSHVNPETGLALKDDPVLAWVTLAGELTLFDLPEADGQDYRSEIDAIRNLMRKDSVSNVRRDWQKAEGDQWKSLAADLRKFGVKVPIAGGSHWKRELDYNTAQTVAGLDLVDDRLFQPPNWSGPEHRSPLWSRDGGIGGFASKKRKTDRPYVAGQWADPTFGAWASPTKGPTCCSPPRPPRSRIGTAWSAVVSSSSPESGARERPGRPEVKTSSRFPRSSTASLRRSRSCHTRRRSCCKMARPRPRSDRSPRPPRVSEQVEPAGTRDAVGWRSIRRTPRALRVGLTMRRPTSRRSRSRLITPLAWSSPHRLVANRSRRATGF